MQSSNNVKNQMNKYKNEAEKAEAMAEAQKKIKDFLKSEYSYTELMVKTAKAQSQIFNLISLCDCNLHDDSNINDLSEFFYFAIKAFELLEPFNENELGAV